MVGAYCLPTYFTYSLTYLSLTYLLTYLSLTRLTGDGRRVLPRSERREGAGQGLTYAYTHACITAHACNALSGIIPCFVCVAQVPDVRKKGHGDGMVLYDSTVDDVKKPSIYVTYHDAQVSDL